MAKAALLFNGIRYSFPPIEKALAWAEQSKGSLTAIFIKAKKEPDEGYIFPSDIDAAEQLNTNEEAHASHLAILQNNINMLASEASRKHIGLEIVRLTDPNAERLTDHLDEIDCLFASDDIYQTGILTADKIDLKKLSVACQFQWKLFSDRLFSYRRTFRFYFFTTAFFGRTFFRGCNF